MTTEFKIISHDVFTYQYEYGRIPKLSKHNDIAFDFVDDIDSEFALRIQPRIGVSPLIQVINNIRSITLYEMMRGSRNE